MARGKMSPGRTVSRPALGKNDTGKFRRPAPAYAADNGTPTVVSSGTAFRPKDPNVRKVGKLLTKDATPRTVQL